MSQHAKPLHFLPSSSPFSFRLWESFCPLFFSSQKTPHLWDGHHFLIHIRNRHPHPKYARFFVCGSNFEITKRFLPFDFFSRFVCGAPGKLAALPYSFRLWKVVERADRASSFRSEQFQYLLLLSKSHAVPPITTYGFSNPWNISLSVLRLVTIPCCSKYSSISNVVNGCCSSVFLISYYG